VDVQTGVRGRWRQVSRDHLMVEPMAEMLDQVDDQTGGTAGVEVRNEMQHLPAASLALAQRPDLVRSERFMELRCRAGRRLPPEHAAEPRPQRAVAQLQLLVARSHCVPDAGAPVTSIELDRELMRLEPQPVDLRPQ
jgi:hypothetical protein